MNFKQFLLLNEFKKRDFYDFYALQALQHHPSITQYGTFYGALSTNKTELDKEIETKIIETGNDILLELVDDIALVIYARYQYAFKNYDVIPIEIMNIINPQNSDWGRNWEVLTKFMGEGWNKIDLTTKIKILESAKKYSTTERRTWGRIIDYCLDVLEIWPINNIKTIVLKINEAMQFVHNSGNLLEYLPKELEKALHTRDVANLAYIVSQASPQTRELIKSAGIGYIGQPKEPSRLEILQTALRRAFAQLKQLKNSTLDLKLLNSDSKESEYIQATLYAPEKIIFDIMYQNDQENKTMFSLYKEIKNSIGLNEDTIKIDFAIFKGKNVTHGLEKFIVEFDSYKLPFVNHFISDQKIKSLWLYDSPNKNEYFVMKDLVSTAKKIILDTFIHHAMQITQIVKLCLIENRKFK